MNTVRPTICASARRGFTLIELIVVIAVTTVLFSLLIIPLIAALRFNQQAQSVTASQDAARITRERLTRELGSAVFVFDGTSHPFQAATIAPGDDRYTNFLDLEIPGLNGAGKYASTIAHAYNAKLDFVLPKANTTGTTDPTTGDQVAYRQSDNGSAIISSPALIFPPAPGTTMVRYWIGLKNPDAPYNNVRERLGPGSTDNTYILYRAQFQPYIKDAATGKLVTNTDLFAPTAANANLPELDDPDFFRTVTTSDVNWLSASHDNYLAAEVADHNTRVENWKAIAKPVIPGPNVDLLALPHNTDNTLTYDKTQAFNGVTAAHSGTAHDPVKGGTYPIVNTTVTFRPGTVSGDATPGTTASYTDQGAVAVSENGFGYTPTVYTTSNKSWSLPYHVSVYPANFDGGNTTDDRGVYYDTQMASSSGVVASTTLMVSVGDVLEYRHVGSVDITGTLVYDVTQGFPVQVGAMGSGYAIGSTNFIPMFISPDTGTITFAAASLPNGPADRYSRAWNYPVPPVSDNGLIDLTHPTGGNGTVPDSPLTDTYTSEDTAAPPVTGVANAHIVPGSLRVFGPDQKPGPGYGVSVPYQEIQPNSTNSETLGDNQFSINYAKGLLHVKTDISNPSSGSISVIYQYQANMTLQTPVDSKGNAAPLSADNPYLPMQVKVDYQTRDLIDVSLGVRIYDVTTGRAQVLPSDTRIKIGNSNR